MTDLNSSAYPDVTGIYSVTLNRDVCETEDAVKWAMIHGLLGKEKTCHCQSQMVLRTSNKISDKMSWRCSNNTCRASKTIRAGSFYERCNLPLTKCIMLSYYWSLGDISQGTVAELLHLNVNRTVPDWFNYHRMLCSQYFRDNPILIGGPGHVVQVYSNVVTAQKRRNGVRIQPYILPQKQVFGGYDMITEKAFLVTVDQKDVNTLFPIILQHVLPGSTVLSDQWAAFRSLMALTEGNNFVKTENDGNVNDSSITFIAPDNSQSNGVEKIIRTIKEKLRCMKGTTDSNITSYIDEFLWRRSIGGQKCKFEETLDLIRTYYPV